jgi:hypothetical protein
MCLLNVSMHLAFCLQTIIFLTQLQEYAETAGAMLLMHGKLPASAEKMLEIRQKPPYNVCTCTCSSCG